MKFLGKLFLVGLLSLSSLYGSELHKVFSLQDQEFADVTSKKLQKYKVNSNMIVSMQLDKIDFLDGYASLTQKQIGFLKLTMIDANIKNWVLTEDLNLYSQYNRNTPTYLKLIDENGLELKLTLNNDGKICAGDRCTQRVGDWLRSTLKIVYVNNKVTFYINNKKLYSSSKRFSKLKYITQSFFTPNYSGTEYDTLVNMTLSEVK